MEEAEHGHREDEGSNADTEDYRGARAEEPAEDTAFEAAADYEADSEPATQPLSKAARPES